MLGSAFTKRLFHRLFGYGLAGQVLTSTGPNSDAAWGIGPAAAVAAHEALADPHPQYTTAAELIAYAQPLDGDLTSLATAAGTNTIYYRSGINTWSAVAIGTGLSFVGGSLSCTVTAPVSSVFGRVGAVVAASGDYTVAQVTGAAPTASPTFTGTVTLPGTAVVTSAGKLGVGTVTPGVTDSNNLVEIVGTNVPLFRITGTAGHFWAVRPNGGVFCAAGSVQFYGTSTSSYSTVTAGGATFDGTGGSASAVVLTVKGATAQSGNLTEWQDGTGAVLASVSSAGKLRVAATTGVPTSIGSGGNYGINFNSTSQTVRIVGTSSITEFIEMGYVSSHSGIELRSDCFYGWTSGVIGVAVDVSLFRSAAGVLKISNTNASSGLGALICGAPAASTIGLTVKGAASQSANFVEFQRASDSLAVFGFTPAGNITFGIGGTGLVGAGSIGLGARGAALHTFDTDANAGNTIASKTLMTVSAATFTPVTVKGFTSQSNNLTEWIKSDGTTVYCTISENGYFTTRKTAAPADAELSASEVAFWFDDTNGASKLMIKGKSANGTVVTGQVALA